MEKLSSIGNPRVPVPYFLVAAAFAAIIGVAVAVFSTSGVAADQSGPTAPTNLAATPGNGVIALSWDTHNGLDVTGYEYQLKRIDGTPTTPWAAFGDAATVSYTIAELTNGVDYEVRLRAVAGDTRGAHATVHAVPYLDVPRPPRSVEVARGDSTITLSWLPPRKSVVDGYEVRWAVKGDEIVTKPWQSVGLVQQHAVPVDSSRHGRTWKFQVRGVNATGAGAVTRVISRPPEPDAPEEFSAFATSGTTALLTWKPLNVNEISGWVYRINRGTSKSQWSKLTGTTAQPDGRLSATINGMSACAPCTYHIKAYNDAGRSPLARDKADHSAPNWTADITLDIGSTQAKLSWTENQIDLTGYQYRLYPGEWVDVALSTVKSNGKKRSWTLTGLDSGSTYLLELRAVNGVGAGQSTVMSVTTE